MRVAAALGLVLLVGCSGPVSGQPPKASAGDPFAALVDNPSQPYRWVSPPPGFDQSNQAPSAGETLIPLANGKSEPAHAFTDDGQVTVSFTAGTFIAPPHETAVRVRITPVKPQPPSPTDVVVDGNAYAIDTMYLPSASGPAALQLPILLNLRYAGHPADAIYRIDGTAWTPIGGTLQQRLLTVEARSSQLGTFAAADRLAAGTGLTGFSGIPFLLGGLVLIGVLLIAGVRVPPIRRRLRSWRPHRDPEDWIT
jgi:hypothetical protein